MPLLGIAPRIQQHWSDCLRDGRDPETAGADNLRTLELVEAAYTSATRGEVVRVEPAPILGIDAGST